MCVLKYLFVKSIVLDFEISNVILTEVLHSINTIFSAWSLLEQNDKGFELKLLITKKENLNLASKK